MKALLDFLRTLLFKRPTQAKGKLPYYIRCDRCGEVLLTEINLQHDLSVTYGNTPAQDRYFTNKIVIGSNLCFQRIEVEVQFDAKKQIIAEEIRGGTRIDKAELDRISGASNVESLPSDKESKSV
jgi:hypothetical protein